VYLWQRGGRRANRNLRISDKQSCELAFKVAMFEIPSSTSLMIMNRNLFPTNANG